MSTVVSDLLQKIPTARKVFLEGMIIRIDNTAIMNKGVYVLLQTDTSLGQFFCIGNDISGNLTLDTNRYNSEKYKINSPLPGWMAEFVVADSSRGLVLR